MKPFDEFSDIEKWENRELGADKTYVEVGETPKELLQLINASKSMQPISIRLPNELIEDLKLIGKKEKLGYQALIREVLSRFVASEKKLMLLELQKRNDELERMVEKLKQEQASNKLANKKKTA